MRNKINKKENEQSSVAVSIRQKAEDQLKKRHSVKAPPVTEADTRKLLHELEVHQVELEMQNEELKIALDKAATATDKFTELYDFAPAGYFTLDRNGIICQLNLNGARMLGKERAGLVKDNFKQFITPDNLPVFNDFLRKILEANSKQTCEVRLTNKGNPSIFVHLEGIISEDEQKCLITAIDITEQKHVEEALRTSEERHRLLADNASDVIWTMDMNGRYTYVSPSVEKLRGYTAAEVMQQSIEESLTPESAAIAQSKLMESFEAMQAGQPFQEFHGELEQHCVDGSTIWTDVTASAMFNLESEFIGILGVTRNIADRKRVDKALKENEEKYRTLLELAPDAFFQEDPQGNFITVNDKAIELTGYSRKELLSMNMSDMFQAKILNEEPLRYDLLKLGDTVITEREIIRKNGQTIHVEMNSKAMQDGTYQCFMRDISERKRAEEALKASEARLRELNATKDKFFSIIAHDLRNPFNSIIGFSNLLERQIQEKDYEGIGRYATIIQNSSQQAMDLLMNLMEWSRLQVGRMEFNPETIEIVALIKQVTEISNDAAQQKSITIYTELPPFATVFADKAMVGTILRNLISNAIKFTHPGGKIVVSAEQKPNELMVTVSDNGLGIKKEAIEKLFRIEESYSTIGTKNEKGTGLGLILCKEFVEKHRGKIWAESELGKGSTFYFTIPRS
jgi:PAS domain S-box-containing protein